MISALFTWALIVSLFQVIHIFEEIALKAYTLEKTKNPLGKYLRVASVLVLISYIIIFLIYKNYSIGYYLSIYLVLISTGNMIVHLVFAIKGKGQFGYGFPSSIPLGISGLVYLWQLAKFLF